MTPHNGNAESLTAYNSHDREVMRRRVLEFIRAQREVGVTADEVCVAFSLPHNSIAPRITELRELGLVVAQTIAGCRVRRETRSGCLAAVVVTKEFSKEGRLF
jgi:B-block binding subunit of TFIIIC